MQDPVPPFEGGLPRKETATAISGYDETCVLEGCEKTRIGMEGMIPQAREKASDG